MLNKSDIRKQIKQIIDDLKDRRLLDKEINENISNYISNNKYKNILSFKPLSDEPNIDPVIELLASSNNLFYANLDELSMSDQNGVIKSEFENIHIILIPGRAYSKDKFRLGRGGGWYDRVLPKLKSDCLKIGICYEVQIFENLPIEDHDRPVDVIITDKSIYED